MLGVPMIYQNPELPQGCEVTSLAMAMNYRGIAVSKTELADHYVPRKDFYYYKGKLYGPNPFVAYAGNPRKAGGWFCYAPPIAEGANRYFQEHGHPFSALNWTGKTESDIQEALRQGNPVVAWVTIKLENIRYKTKWHFEGTGQKTLVPSNLHCVLIYGMDENKVYYADPLDGKMAESRGKFFQRYYDLGGHAVVIQGTAGVPAKSETFINTNLSERSDTLRVKTSEGYMPVPNREVLMNQTAEVLIDIDRASKYLEMEWFISPVGDELYLYGESLNLTLKLNSDQVILNGEKKTFHQQTRRIDKKYYVSLQDLMNLFEKMHPLEQLAAKGW